MAFGEIPYRRSASRMLVAIPMEKDTRDKIGSETAHARPRRDEVIHGSLPSVLSWSTCSEISMVPSSAAIALPTLPASTTRAQITGVSSRVNAKPRRPPMTRVRPTLLNSLQNWMVNTIPTNDGPRQHGDAEGVRADARDLLQRLLHVELALPQHALDHEPEQKQGCTACAT